MVWSIVDTTPFSVIEESDNVKSADRDIFARKSEPIKKEASFVQHIDQHQRQIHGWKLANHIDPTTVSFIGIVGESTCQLYDFVN